MFPKLKEALLFKGTDATIFKPSSLTVREIHTAPARPSCEAEGSSGSTLWEESALQQQFMDSKVCFLNCFAFLEPILQKPFAILLIAVVPICEYRDVLGKFSQEMDPLYF